MEANEVVTVLNQDPEGLLNAVWGGARTETRVDVDGRSCKVVRNNIAGGVVIFLPERAVRFKWDKQAKRWLLP